MKVCSIENCDKPLLARGWCSAHYNLWRKHGKPERAIGRHGRGLKDPTYLSWSAMKSRCSTGKYRGRFTVTDRWKGPDGFVNFLHDVGERPPRKTLDRIDNTKGYYPENCRWASRKEQGRNTSANLYVEYKGESLPLVAHCERHGMPYLVVFKRLRRGWSVTKALGRPVIGK